MQVAKQAREQARAVERSARLLLSHIHDLYDIARNKKRFVDALRRYPLEVLKQANDQFRKQVHRDDIRDRASYFAALVRRCNESYHQRRACLQQEARERRQRQEHGRAIEQQRRQQASAPALMIREGLELIALQWDSITKQLLFDGEGPGKGMLEKAFRDLTNSVGRIVSTDTFVGALSKFEIANKSSLEGSAKKRFEHLLLVLLAALRQIVCRLNRLTYRPISRPVRL